MIRKFDAFKLFCDATHVLEMLKGGFGLMDAPQLFTTKVDVTLKKHGMFPTHADKKIYIKHENGVLVLICSAHMDDFKATGDMKWLEWLQNLLQKDFGAEIKLDLSKNFLRYAWGGCAATDMDFFMVAKSG